MGDDDSGGDEARAHVARGDALATARDYAGAAGAYRHAMALRPEWSAPYLSLANVHIERAEYGAALGSLATARAVGDDSASGWHAKGRAFAGLQDWEAARWSFVAALERDRAMPSTWHRLGHVLRTLGRFDEAREALRNAVEGGEVAAQPSYVASVIELGDVEAASSLLARFEASIDPPARGWLAAQCAFLRGDLPAAWAANETRPADVQSAPLDSPRWRGEDLNGRSIAVVAEQGFGDVIQFARFTASLVERGARVHWVLPPALRTLGPLLAHLPSVASLTVLPEPVVADVHVPLLSLPHELGVRLDAIPSTPYLSAPTTPGIPLPSREPSTLNVGIVWGGDPRHGNDCHRSASFASMLGLSSVPGVRLFSLQLGPRAAEQRGYEAVVTDLARSIADWRDTASLIGALDLVISVDTSVAHLAGALGQRVWIALAFAPDARWMLGREDTPWYPTARLFRQSTAGAWAPVFERMRHELSVITRQRASARTALPA